MESSCECINVMQPKGVFHTSGPINKLVLVQGRGIVFITAGVNKVYCQALMQRDPVCTVH